MNPFYAAAILAIALGAAPFALAEENNPAPYSSSLYGPLGLNTVPNARFDPVGTIRAQISTLDPYAHASLGVQIADPLYIALRQSAEISSLTDNADELFPGVDAKIRLLNENAHRPEIAIGFQSAIGHRQTAGEYLALSKRYKDFDFTAGVGWGRFASAGHFTNPLGGILQHFKRDRPLSGEDPNTAADWFTGENIGILAGIEYFTPVNGLSLKADIGGDRFEAEQASSNFDAGAPWSLGFNYKPRSFVDIGMAMQGTDKIMARLSLQNNIKNWPHRSTKDKAKTSAPLRPFRTNVALPTRMEQRAEKENIALSGAHIHETVAAATLALNSDHSTPHQIKRAAVHMANNAGPDVEGLTIAPTHSGLRGPSITLMRRDFENALRADKQGSAEEIWHSAEIKNIPRHKARNKTNASTPLGLSFKDINFKLQNQISLSEEDEGVLYRASLIAETKGAALSGLLRTGLGLRLNIADNLDDLNALRPIFIDPVRSNVDDFADTLIGVDTGYIAATQTLLPSLHGSALVGYLEEMYAGFGGEILYRPFDKRYAFGVDSFAAIRRDPDSFLNLDLIGTPFLSAHANAWYDIPKADITIGAKAGRFLAGDIGATLSLRKNFKNGAQLEGYTTLSNASEIDLFGGTTSADHGIRLSLPLGGYTGGFKYAKSATIETLAAPLGRNIGQSINNPLPLYALTQPLSKAHLIKHWDEITD